MPYRDKGKEKDAARERMRKMRAKGVTKTTGVTPYVTPDVIPPDPWDWSDRRNYSEVYLRCLDEQGGVLTEKSAPMMQGVTIRKAQEGR